MALNLLLVHPSLASLSMHMDSDTVCEASHTTQSPDLDKAWIQPCFCLLSTNMMSTIYVLSQKIYCEKCVAEK